MSMLAFHAKITAVLCFVSLCAYGGEQTFSPVTGYPLDDIILDIYRAATELGEVDYEQLQTDLYALHDSPLDLNTATEEDLSRLSFLSPRQIDEILAYAYRHPFRSLYELRLIPSLAEYEIRDLLPFVQISDSVSGKPDNKILYAREVFAHARHELTARIDARDIEHFSGTDPVYVHSRYRFDYRRRVTFGFQLRRPEGAGARGLQYGAYLQLKDIAPHLHTVVAGTFQASFGRGLVFAPVYHNGKPAYVSTVCSSVGGLRYYSSVDGEGLQGIGATFRWQWGTQSRLDASALYSLKRSNESTLHHVAGFNLTYRHRQVQVELTAAENIWSDSIRPYRDAAYNARYFRGRSQVVIGASARYNHGWFDAFAEIAAAQNKEWGFGIIAGSRFYPADGVTLVALYRYYSPWFDNALGYAFSETSRIGDENGGYLGADITRLRHWRFSGYADVFRFAGPKYGIPEYPSVGFDAMAEAQYILDDRKAGIRVRARKKGESPVYSARMQYELNKGPLSLRTTAEANIIPSASSVPYAPYGLTLYQDVSYRFLQVPMTLHGRVQFFDARNWANRIYCYENDVLYAFSNGAVYGLGGRAYLCLTWRIIKPLTLYFRVSETIWHSGWYNTYRASSLAHSRPHRTDCHLLLKCSF